jgi:molecular chaperone DnaK (HSP70)
MAQFLTLRPQAIQELFNSIFKKLISDAEQEIRETITRVTLVKSLCTSPLSINNTSTKFVPVIDHEGAMAAIQRSARAAGIAIEASLDEPCAFVDYYARINDLLDGIFIVIDVGGGTCDVSLVKLENRVRFLLHSNKLFLLSWR